MDIAKLVYELEQLAKQSNEQYADIEEIHGLADSLLLEYINNNDFIKTINKSLIIWLFFIPFL